MASPPATLRWSTTERPGGQVFRYRLRTDADQPTRVVFCQPLPADPAVADVGFRLDAAPEEWTAEGGAVTACATVEPGESLELVLGIAFETADAVALPPAAPSIESVEPDSRAGPEADRRNRTWDRPPAGVDPETVEAAIESVDTDASRDGGGFGIGSDAVHGELSLGFGGDTGGTVRDGDADTVDGAAAGGAGADSDGQVPGDEDGPEDREGGDRSATRAALREAVADRNEELMRLRAELAVARRERADLRETVRDLRETVEALADYGATDDTGAGED